MGFCGREGAIADAVSLDVAKQPRKRRSAIATRIVAESREERKPELESAK